MLNFNIIVFLFFFFINRPDNIWDQIETSKINIEPNYSILDELFFQKINTKKEKENVIDEKQVN